MKKLIIILIFISIKSFSQCNEIKKDVDKFNGYIMYSSPLIYHGGVLAVIPPMMKCIKTIANNDTVVMLYLAVGGNTLNINSAGVIMLFDDGTKIEKVDQKIDEEAEVYGWQYTAYIKLELSDIEKLKAHILTDIRLYIYDGEIKKSKAEKLKEYLNCLIEK